LVCNLCGWSLESHQACVWFGGGPPVALGVLPGSSNSAASGVSADGSVVVGRSDGRAFRWTGAGMVDLGAFDATDPAVAVSADGAIVVGRDSTVGAFIWDPVHGMRELRTVLLGLGVELNGWTLTHAVGVSADGRTIVGNGTNPAALPEAWIAFLGDPVSGACYANCDGSTTAPALNINDFTCFFNRFAAGDSRANCDASTAAPVLNVIDFTCFLNAFAEGCS
jgi:probable HAF family extracellular repeat protein